MQNSRLSLVGIVACLAVGLGSVAAEGDQVRPGMTEVEAVLNDIETRLERVAQAGQQNLAKVDRLEPFTLEIPGGLANSGAFPSANPRIIIDSNGAGGHFVVDSILLKTNVPPTGFFAASVNSFTINGTLYDTRSKNLIGYLGSGARESVDLLGSPVRVSFVTSPETGGNLPSEVIAACAGADDIDIKTFFRSDDSDLNIETIRISGLKRAKDTITATYVPGL